MIVYKRADNPTDLDEVHRLRFRVFCEERSVERSHLYPSGRERDDYDAFSIHFIARHFDIIPVGTVRLVRDNPMGWEVEKFCTAAVNRERGAEISKLAISKVAIKISGAAPKDVILGLFRILYEESRCQGIRYLYARLTKSACRLFCRYGIPFISLSGNEGKGYYAPYFIDMMTLNMPPAPHGRIVPGNTGSGMKRKSGFIDIRKPGRSKTLLH